MPNTLTWFRQDLRLADNPAVLHAVEAASGGTWLPIYVFSPEEEGRWARGEASCWWLHHSLMALDATLKERGSNLQVFRGSSDQILQSLCARHDIGEVHWNRRYEPKIIDRDKLIKTALLDSGISVTSHSGSLFHEPWQFETDSGGPYRVFTPYWRKARSRLRLDRSTDAPRSLPPVPEVSGALSIEALNLTPSLDWADGFAEYWTPGEAGALDAMEAFTDGAMSHYRKGRDIPSQVGTSRMSPHLHFGEISPWKAADLALAAAAVRPADEEEAEGFVRELGWREFSYALLYHFPHTIDQPLNEKFANFTWRNSRSDLTAWQKGNTGIPIVDAGMRELWGVGWMHNRVRMLVASFLTKNLRIHWLEGARWFWDTLLDADLANNTQGWQWTAGSGADAAPYFRVFNPVLQGQKFDKQGEYVKRWVPELSEMPQKWIHEPWNAPPKVLADAGVCLGETYPNPIVDLKKSRQAALAAYQEVK